jgi:hypothetical protein
MLWDCWYKGLVEGGGGNVKLTGESNLWSGDLTGDLLKVNIVLKVMSPTQCSK